MNEKIDAIFNEDLSDFLKKNGELIEIEKGNRFCKICGSPISISNIQIVIPHQEKGYEYVCESINCVENYYLKK